MRTERISQSYTFTAQVHKRFIAGGEKFYNKRNLTVLYDKFRKQIERMEFYGEPNTIIKHNYNYAEGKHILYIENKDLNAKQGVVMRISDKFSDILNFFNDLKAKNIEEAEDTLIV